MEIDLCVRAEVHPFLRRLPIKTGKPMLHYSLITIIGGNEGTQESSQIRKMRPKSL